MSREAADPARELVTAARERMALGPFLVALDFDGTLTEIDDDPEAPSLAPERREILARVPAARRWLAIVSGRALHDVRARIGIEGAIVVGNHGLEIEGAEVSLRLAPTGTENRLSALLSSLPLDDAASIEEKGPTASLHVRPRGDDARHAALGAAIRRPVEAAGFVLRPGKAVWEIRPAGAADKGEAIRRLLHLLPGAAAERAIYVGDDRTDEDAFLALGDGLTARVGPPAVETAARYRIPDPAAVYRFLDELLRS